MAHWLKKRWFWFKYWRSEEGKDTKRLLALHSAQKRRQKLLDKL